MIRPLYNWTMKWAGHRLAVWALAFISFIESSVFPIPPDVLMIPMVLARRALAWIYASIATIASVAGALLGYWIGAVLFEELAKPILDFYGYGARFEDFKLRFNESGVWVVLFAGLTPFPFKVITLASGATGLSLPVFILSSIVARGLRFFIVCGLLYWLGPPIRDFIERWLGWLFALFLILLIGAFALVPYLA